MLAGCGGSEFMPHPGPFSGGFSSGEVVLGSFTLTVTDGLVGGTGSLMHNALPINVSISGVISGKSISGQVVNASIGAGEFTGSFRNEETALGNFVFHGSTDQQTTSGTWLAVID